MNDGQRFEFDLRVVRMEAIKKAAYRWATHFIADIQQVDEHHVTVDFIAKTSLKGHALKLEEFANDVLDQELREVVAEETQTIRNVLLAQAFSGIAVASPELESVDFRGDPLSISKGSR